jgi:hypothetical protein
LSVSHVNDPVRPGSYRRIMGDNEQSGFGLPRPLEQQVDDCRAGHAVEITGWLIRE